jgi:hypothetical protein
VRDCFSSNNSNTSQRHENIDFLIISTLKKKNEIKLYVCYNCLNNFRKNKTPLYQVPNSISRNEIIPSVQRLTQLEEHLISPRLAFAQIYKIHGYGQYTMHGSIINVPSNINETQSILP